jgi:hypothetical protein
VIGVSVSHKDGPSGTLGAFVECDDGDAILSASHVLALSGTAGRNAVICHPGGSDLDQITDDHHIARLKKLGYVEVFRKQPLRCGVGDT